MVKSKKHLKQIQVMWVWRIALPETNISPLKTGLACPHTERIIRKPTKKSNHRLVHIIPSIGHTWFCPETSEGVNPLNISNFHGSTNQKPGDGFTKPRQPGKGSMEEKPVGANHPPPNVAHVLVIYQLVVEPTHLKNMSEIGSFPQRSGWT